MIQRLLENIIIQKFGRKKALIVLGARQTGKTTLIKKIINQITEPTLILNADLPIVQQQLENPSLNTLKQIFGKAKLVFIDEAQRIQNIGITLKIIIDEIPDVQIIVTGSSAFELSNTVNEPLTGRKFEYRLYPISWMELVNHTNYIESLSQLQQRIIFGMYPDVINNLGEEKETLLNLTESYLYKDIIVFQKIRKPEFVQKLLQALAFQVGSEVSYNELSILLQIDRKTIIHYIDLLEKAYVIFRLPSFSRNLRNELSSKIKIYFYDTGVRNALIGDFRPFEMRTDKGALWENFLISEKLKTNHYSGKYVKSYFWKTHQKKEIDYIEESDGKLVAFEIKWKAKLKTDVPKLFTDTYKNSTFELISFENFHQFLNNG
ncbi:MAG TPA: ATP-binding protein [Draconibacterium sp.]|nr:ATP-binding protein [Draconibacterium sp.]